MARRGMSGQLNMFDFFNSLDAGAPGEVEMVSLVPSFEEEEEPEVEEIPEVEEEPKVVEEPEVVKEPEVVEEPEVEEVPEAEEIELEIEDEPAPVLKEDMTVAMSRSYVQDGKKIEIAYINYNKVRITKGDETPIIKEFASTKEAVNYYVEQMQELEADE